MCSLNNNAIFSAFFFWDRQMIQDILVNLHTSSRTSPFPFLVLGNGVTKSMEIVFHFRSGVVKAAGIYIVYGCLT